MLPLLLAAMAAVGVLSACGGESTEDPRAAEVQWVIDQAAGEYVNSGPTGLWYYLTTETAQRCTKDLISKALAGQPVPIAFVKTEKIGFGSDGTARATVVFRIREGGEEELEWVFAPVPNQTWRLIDVPGLEGCGQ